MRPLCSRFVLVLALVLVGASGSVSNARGDGDSFTWSGTCTEIASGGLVPGENVRPYVPANFRILGEQAGTALLNVGISTCHDMVIDGEPVNDAFSGFIAVFIQGREGPGVDRYYLWSNGSSRELGRRLTQLGMPSIVSRKMTFEMEGDGPMVSATGTVPRVGRSQGGYRAAVTTSTLAPVSITAPGPPYWHVGRRGLAKATFDVTTLEDSAGPAVIEAQPGTVMSELIGGERLEGGALLIRFRFDATIGIMEDPS